MRRLVSDECGDMAVNLHDAVVSGDVVDVRRLVAAGADVDEQRGEARSMPLHWAAHVGQVEVMRVLVELGANKDAKCAGGATPLHHAARTGHAAAVSVLIELGAQIDAQDANGDTSATVRRRRC